MKMAEEVEWVELELEKWLKTCATGAHDIPAGDVKYPRAKPLHSTEDDAGMLPDLVRPY